MPEARDCIEIETKVLANPVVKAALSTLNMEQINIMSGDQRITQLSVFKAPTFIILRPDGKEVTRRTGYLSTEEFLALITE